MKLNFILLLSLILGITILFNNCSENPIELTQNIFGPNSQGTIKDTILYVQKDTCYFIKSQTSTSSSQRILIGEYKGLISKPIFRFLGFGTIPDTAQVDSSGILLHVDGSMASYDASPMSITMYPILNKWNSNTDSVWNDYQQNVDFTTPLSEYEINPNDSSNIYLPLNSDGLDLLSHWMDPEIDDDEKTGIILDFTSANFIHKFYSLNYGLPPQIVIHYTIPDDSSYSDTLSVSLDCFLYEGSIPIEEDFNYVSTLLIYNTLLDFDIKGFIQSQPRDISLLSANLQLFIDKDNSLIDQTFRVSSLTTQLRLSSFEDSEVEVDSVFGFSVSLTSLSSDSTFLELPSGSNRRYFATGILNYISALPDSAFGLAINYVSPLSLSGTLEDETNYYSYLASYRYNHPDSALHARLYLTYWIPPAPRL